MRCPPGVLCLAGVLALLWALFAAAGARAHEIPADAAVQAFVKPAGSELQVLIRVPMAAMREVDIPRRGPGYLDLARSGPALEEAARLWLADNIDVFENGRKLPYPKIAQARVSLPSDRSFASYEEARAHLASPALPQDTELYWSQGLLDVLLTYSIESERSDFSVDPRLARLAQRTVLSLRFLPPGGGELRAFEITGDAGLIRLDPRWHQAALRFVEAGFLHILDGTDHLLFILCLVIPFRHLRALVLIVTSFTLAHSITLIGSAFGLAPDGLWFPPLVETLIAASILYMALENIVGSSQQRRWMIAFGFGLVHGFGFSFALRETLQFAGSHLLTSLLAFNVGVELGQVLVLALMVPALNLLFRFVPEKVGSIILSALVAHTAWHWMLERGERLRQFPMPAFDGAALAQAMRGTLMLVVLGVLGWLLRATWTRWKASEDKPGDR
jgi:hypothetical protein